MIATEIEGRMHDLLGVANTADGTGGYLFSGYRGTTIPFIQTDTGALPGRPGPAQAAGRLVALDRDQRFGQRDLREQPHRQRQLPDRHGRRPPTRAAGSPHRLGVDATKLTGHNYTLEFKVAGTPAVTTYTVTDKRTPRRPAPC
jgi:flagellar hook-associated protein 3 FlgL